MKWCFMFTVCVVLWCTAESGWKKDKVTYLKSCLFFNITIRICQNWQFKFRSVQFNHDNPTNGVSISFAEPHQLYLMVISIFTVGRIIKGTEQNCHYVHFILSWLNFIFMYHLRICLQDQYISSDHCLQRGCFPDYLLHCVVQGASNPQ